MNLNVIAENIRKCTRCVLWKHRLQALPGEGELGAKIMVVLGSPDEHADRKGSIWEGITGKNLLKLMKEKKIAREDVFLTTLVKCSPHGSVVDRLEIEECSQYLHEQIRALIHLKKIYVVSSRDDLGLPPKAILVNSIKEIKF